MTAADSHAQAAQLPQGDVIAILLEQHARIQQLFAEITSAHGDYKQHAFDELRALLAVHETAEEMVLRPVSRKTAGEAVAQARNDEENQATHVLAELEKMDVQSAEFDRMFATFQQSVTSHATHEETEEFPSVISGRDDKERARMGSALRAAEKSAPTHPHPTAAGSTTAQYVVGPFASLVDRVRDAIKGGTSSD
ncbi:MAG: hemerythrin domain-containing protein [Pseudonocardia sp.]|nr:hemerythrin domain-containing protein [Pseudonocardia sp.]